MTVWVAIPTCNDARAVKAVEAWSRMGYLPALYTEPDQTATGEVTLRASYPGYWSAGAIICWLLQQSAVGDAARLTLVLAADDMTPDPARTAQEIEADCYNAYGDTWVMQPVGDDLKGTDQIAGSPWLSSGWIARAYEGRFPVPTWYRQYFGDEELLNVARGLGVFHQRADITQRHDHWSRPGGPKITEYQRRNSSVWWSPDKSTFLRRQAEGWPGSRLL